MGINRDQKIVACSQKARELGCTCCRLTVGVVLLVGGLLLLLVGMPRELWAEAGGLRVTFTARRWRQHSTCSPSAP